MKANKLSILLMSTAMVLLWALNTKQAQAEKSVVLESSNSPQLLEAFSSGNLADMDNFYVPSTSRHIAQASWQRILNSLDSYIQSNLSYFKSYALRKANGIGRDDVRWSSATLDLYTSNGRIVLDLTGRASVPWPFSDHGMRLRLFFNPNSCLQYSYSGHNLDVEGIFEGRIRDEVRDRLNDSRTRSDIEESLNSQVYQSLVNLQLLDDLGC